MQQGFSPASETQILLCLLRLKQSPVLYNLQEHEAELTPFTKNKPQLSFSFHILFWLLLKGKALSFLKLWSFWSFLVPVDQFSYSSYVLNTEFTSLHWRKYFHTCSSPACSSSTGNTAYSYPAIIKFVFFRSEISNLSRKCRCRNRISIVKFDDEMREHAYLNGEGLIAEQH